MAIYDCPEIWSEPGSVEVKSNGGVESPVDPEGPELIDVSGGVLSPPVVGLEVTGGRSEVVDASIVYGPALEGLVMPLKVTRTWSLAAIDELPNRVHTIVVPLGLPQLPTVSPLVTSSTWPLV